MDKAIKEMIDQDVIEEHPANEPAPRISCAAIAPKPDGNMAQLAGNKVFSKMDFKSAFWQLELHPESRYLTVFHANNKLYRYKRLTIGLKPAQGELNVALQPTSAHIPEAHQIHDDLIVAAENHQKHDQAIQLVMEAIDRSGLTLNPLKCQFGKPEIKFWGMVINA